jgi:hypothetical protein
MINVWGDSVGAGIVAHLSRKEINDFEMEQKLQLKNTHYVDNDIVLGHNMPAITTIPTYNNFVNKSFKIENENTESTAF